MRLTTKTIIVTFITLLLLNGCSSVIDQPVTNNTAKQSIETRNQQLSALTTWALSGKIAFINAKERQSASLFWQRNEIDNTESLNLSTMFGINVLQLERSGENFTVEVDGNHYQTTDLDSLIYSLTGLNLPTRAMSFWLKGLNFLPSDKISYHPETQLPVSLVSHYNNLSWRIQYDKYHVINQYQLAKQLTIIQGDLRIKIVIHSWKI